MKLTKSTLKRIIKEELEAIAKEGLVNEMQTSVGLPHQFTGFDLAKRIFAALQGGEPEETIMTLRDMALSKIRDVRYDISQGIDAENKNQEDMFLQQAVDEIDKYREDYDTDQQVHGSPEFMSRMGVPNEGPYKGYPLRRRNKQNDRKLNQSYYRNKK